MKRIYAYILSVLVLAAAFTGCTAEDAKHSASPSATHSNMPTPSANVSTSPTADPTEKPSATVKPSPSDTGSLAGQGATNAN